jgi:hypothetical protein
MEEENDVSNRIVKQVHKVNPINVLHMEAENDVLNLIVRQAPDTNPTNV